MRRYGWILGCMVLVVAGCDSDSSPGGEADGGPLADGSVSGGAGGVGGSATGGTGGSAGTGATGGSSGTGGTTGDEDAGTDPAVDGGGSGSGGSGGGDTLPVDGTRLAVCYRDADCGTDLACSQYGDSAGFCIETCAGNDKDCMDIGSIQTTCGSGNVCRADCAGTGDGDGDCPDKMECAKIVTGLPPLGSTTYRCQYPAGSGAKDTGPYGECDSRRGDADCMADLSCQSGTGMCTADCTEDSDCSDPGTNATPKCDKPALSSTGTCGLECSNDKDCPGNLLCQNASLLDLVGILGKRCAAP